MLLSKSSLYPNGIGNSSGHVGHNFCEHLMGPGVNGLDKELVGKPRTLDDGRPGSFYLARFRNLTDRNPKFLRGYGFEGGSGTGMFPDNAYSTPGFGSAYKKTVRDYAGAFIGMGGFGEVLPRYENYVELDPEVKDRWGVPVLRFHIKFGDNEKKMAADMADSAREMFEAAGIEVLSVSREILTEGLFHPRIGHLAHGRGSEEIGSESVSAIARRAESAGGGWQHARERVVPESDLDHHGALLALLRSPGRRIEEGECLMSYKINRRDLIRIGAGAALAAPAAFAVADAPKFFTPAEFAMLDELTETIIPSDDHSPGARAAQVAAYIDARVAEAFEPKERDDWRNGLKLVDELSRKMHGVTPLWKPVRSSASRCSRAWRRTK
jgi:hypothetical protein